MPKPKALVIGGTGPTGPTIVEGLHARGYAVTILHSGRHEVEFSVPGVQHIHADPHFPETLAQAVGDVTYDLVVALYGRLRIIAEFMRGRAGRMVAVGTARAFYAGPADERWGGLGRPPLVPDTSTVFRRDAGATNMEKLSRRMVEAMETFFACHPAGTYLGYCTNYGPRQTAPHDWAIVRRILDGRTPIVIADGGIKAESRVYTVNAARALLLAIDRPDAAAGKRYTITDRSPTTIRQRIEFIARHLGAPLELVDVPYEFAWPCWPYYQHGRENFLVESMLIRHELGYEDAVAPDVALGATVDWLVANRPSPAGEEEQKIGDPFDYAGEDALIARWHGAAESLQDVKRELSHPGHAYRHPKQPG